MARKSTVDEKEALECVYTAALAKIALGQLTTNAAFLAYKSEGVKRQTLYDRVAGALPRNKAQTARQLGHMCRGQQQPSTQSSLHS